MRNIAIFSLILLFSLWAGSAVAQQDSVYVRSGDTIRYTYTPVTLYLPEESSNIEESQEEKKKKNFFQSVYRYFQESAEDKTFEKPIDISVIGGISYSPSTSAGIALMAVGQYRIDRSDSITKPSYLSLYGTVSLTGYYSVGIEGKTFLPRKRGHFDYEVAFSSQPTDFWGVGYEAASTNRVSSFVRKRVMVDFAYLYPIARNTFIGTLADFNFTRGKNFTRKDYLPAGEDDSYTATGMGVVIEYDSRDVVTNPSRGGYISLREKIYPKGLGDCGSTLWETTLRADYYQRLWRSGVFALDLYAELHSEGTPWFMLSRLGGSYRMRGYYEGRYTDNNMILVQAELRQRIWHRLGCVVWAGAGNIFDDFRRFDWSHTLPNYGVGLRWEFKKGVNVRIDYGFGRKTHGLILNINEAF